MTQIRPTPGRTLAEHRDLVVVFLVIVGALVAMLAATAVLGWNLALPTYDVVPDPAGALPF
jgi:hypothetical protein